MPGPSTDLTPRVRGVCVFCARVAGRRVRAAPSAYGCLPGAPCQRLRAAAWRKPLLAARVVLPALHAAHGQFPEIEALRHLHAIQQRLLPWRTKPGSWKFLRCRRQAYPQSLWTTRPPSLSLALVLQLPGGAMDSSRTMGAPASPAMPLRVGLKLSIPQNGHQISVII